MNPHNSRQFRRSLSLTSALMAAGLMTLAALPNPLQAAAPAETGAQFTVLDATTGSGSSSQAAAKPPVQFEVLGAATGSGMGLKGQEEIVPAVAPVVTAQNKAASQNKAAAQGGAETQAGAEDREAVFAALDSWHQRTLANYKYDITALQDPFLPIQEVRGEKPESLDENALAKLPPLQRLSLNQLKLVAITTLSGGSGGALASFEDGAGSSYILRQGDLIGRDNGRITRIEATQVTVEETPRHARGPQETVIKLNVSTNNTGLTRESDDPNAQATGTQN
ncbi:MAG: pilus assembly protein PilP [Candidatus Adiutrix sp.]|jgi:Tfp pilus assembly protein PilP|nr:pilus assembly protein PilP [Candidatus Adiutrix sp.]